MNLKDQSDFDVPADVAGRLWRREHSQAVDVGSVSGFLPVPVIASLSVPDGGLWGYAYPHSRGISRGRGHDKA